MGARSGLLLLLLAGCATVEQDFEQAKSSWQGATLAQVTQQWGASATSEIHPDGSEVRTWVTQEPPVQAPGPQVGVGVFGGSGGGGVGVGVGVPFGGSVSRASCTRKLTFKGGAVVKQDWDGDPGYCTLFKRR